MTQPRICFVSLSSYGYFEPDATALGGAGRQLALLSRELTADFEVSVVVGDFGQPVVVTRDGVTLYRAYRPDPDASTTFKTIQLLKLLAAMRRADADIYVYRGRPWKAAFTYLLTRTLRSRWVYNLANDPNVDEQPDALPAPIRWLFERALADAEAIITQTPYQATRLRERYGIQSATVPNGYPIPEEVPPHEQRDGFLWVGRLDEQQKRPHLYLDIAESLPHLEFLLAGPNGLDKTYNERIRSRAASLNNVTDLGTVDPDRIHDYYAGAVALVNTSRTEGFPNTFLEAWRYDTPVVSLDVDPNRFVDPEVDGYAFGDIERLITLLEDLNDDVARRQALGKSAGEYVRSELSIESVAEQYATTLEKAISDRI